MDTRFQRNPQVETASLQDETVLLNPADNKFCVLNRTAAFLWENLAEPRTAGQLADQLSQSFDGVTRDDALRDIQDALNQLTSLALVSATS
ncbi:MAG: PqqD family protein [Acidobacteria bacterium]|nr:PqqD family protein [Acidobacteriota bacterium]